MVAVVVVAVELFGVGLSILFIVVVPLHDQYTLWLNVAVVPAFEQAVDGPIDGPVDGSVDTADGPIVMLLLFDLQPLFLLAPLL